MVGGSNLSLGNGVSVDGENLDGDRSSSFFRALSTLETVRPISSSLSFFFDLGGDPISARCVRFRGAGTYSNIYI